LEEVVLKCLEKDPEDRYQTAKEIAVDLRRMMAPSSASRRAAALPAKRFGRVARFVWPTVVISFVSILMLGGRVFQPAFFQRTRSLAVLPIVDESKDASTQYISDGITEGVIGRLSEVPSLKVMSRNSVFRFKGRETDAQSAGRELHVQAVLTGRIVRQADALVLNAELVNVNDGSQIWGRQFRYSMSDLSRAQDDLAAAVCDKLRLRLSSVEEARLGTRITDNAEAYQIYLQARFHLNQRTGASVQKSIDLFQQATEKDPNFALAYAGLADAYNLSNVLGIQSPRESSPEAKAAATKALVLDPRLGEAHAALGLVKSHYDYDFPSAQRLPESNRAQSQLCQRSLVLRGRVSHANGPPPGSHCRDEEVP
jgi:TolB-like protein